MGLFYIIATGYIESKPVFLQENQILVKRGGAQLECSVAAVLDLSFTKRFNSTAQNRVREIVGKASEIFINNFGVSLKLTTIASVNTTFGTDAYKAFDNFHNSIIKGSLNSYGVFTGSHCLHHLFTEEDFGAVLGIAYVDGICSKESQLMVSSAHQEDLSLVSAHEFGHSFASDHDSKECSVGGPYLMSAYMSSSEQLSSCSISVIKKRLALGASCLTKLSAL